MCVVCVCIMCVCVCMCVYVLHTHKLSQSPAISLQLYSRFPKKRVSSWTSRHVLQSVLQSVLLGHDNSSSRSCDDQLESSFWGVCSALCSTFCNTYCNTHQSVAVSPKQTRLEWVITTLCNTLCNTRCNTYQSVAVSQTCDYSSGLGTGPRKVI